MDFERNLKSWHTYQNVLLTWRFANLYGRLKDSLKVWEIRSGKEISLDENPVTDNQREEHLCFYGATKWYTVCHINCSKFYWRYLDPFLSITDFALCLCSSPISARIRAFIVRRFLDVSSAWTSSWQAANNLTIPSRIRASWSIFSWIAESSNSLEKKVKALKIFIYLKHFP